MAILNVTTDSFYDGGKYLDKKSLGNRIKEIIEEGADIIDIGAQSTFVDRVEISVEEELERVLMAVDLCKNEIPRRDVIHRVSTVNPWISIDTYRSQVAEEAIKHGANMINDVTGLRGDSNMVKIIAKYKLPIVIMYSKDVNSRTTKDEIDYEDVIQTISDFFDERINFAVKNGIKREQIILDPGMGFFVSGKAKYSFEILDRLAEFKKFDLPILVGTSRKSFLSLDGKLKPEERLEASLASAKIAINNGANIIRAHDVKETREIMGEIEVRS